MSAFRWRSALWLSIVGLLLGALLHLLVPLWGPAGYAAVGAPPGLVWMAQAGLWRPLLTCIVIALLLLIAAAYGLSALGRLPRLPLQKAILALVGTGLLVRGLLFVPLAYLQPDVLARICGRCQDANAFVWSTSVLCVLLSVGYLGAALFSGRNGGP
jgi:hypothetical protein